MLMSHFELLLENYEAASEIILCMVVRYANENLGRLIDIL